MSTNWSLCDIRLKAEFSFQLVFQFSFAHCLYFCAMIPGYESANVLTPFPSGMSCIVEVIGLEMADLGRECAVHACCGRSIKEDDVVVIKFEVLLLSQGTSQLCMKCELKKV
jgi:hypothetical protein